MIGKAKVTTDGIEHHADFPETVEGFDVILFHELMHAFLHQVGVATRLRELGQKDKPPALGALKGIKVPGGANPEDSVEETLVVGLLGGKGVPLSENTYRCQRELTLRPSYKSVGIDEGQGPVDAHDWGVVATAPKQIAAALEEIGLSTVQANFVATGMLPS